MATMKAMMILLFCWVCAGMDVDVHDGGGDGGGGEPPPWKQPPAHVGALDDFPEWPGNASQQQSDLDWQTPFLRMCHRCHKTAYLRKEGCANPGCHLFYVTKAGWQPGKVGKQQGSQWTAVDWNRYWERRPPANNQVLPDYKPLHKPRNRGVKRRENTWWKDFQHVSPQAKTKEPILKSNQQISNLNFLGAPFYDCLHR